MCSIIKNEKVWFLFENEGKLKRQNEVGKKKKVAWYKSAKILCAYTSYTCVPATANRYCITGKYQIFDLELYRSKTLNDLLKL